MIEGFSPGWLALREPFDLRSRSPALLARLAEWRQGRGPLRIVDLGSGTGANLRCTAPALGGAQDWTLVEWDRSLIACGERLLGEATVGWRYRRLDLAHDLERIADGRFDLITAAALIDLVAADWLDRLVGVRRRTGAALYIALSFDGRIAWEPADPLDPPVHELVGVHQRTDKGFGPALGPAAADALPALLATDDGKLTSATSDWSLGPADRAIQLELLAGYENAAISTAPGRAGEVVGWAQRRREQILAGASSLRVGHRDLLLLPT
jgi:hypothetical protein